MSKEINDLNQEIRDMLIFSAIKGDINTKLIDCLKLSPIGHSENMSLYYDVIFDTANNAIEYAQRINTIILDDFLDNYFS